MQFRGRPQQRDRQPAQELGLIALRNDADARKSARGADGGIGIGGQGDGCPHTGFDGAAREGGSQFLRRAEEAVQAGHVASDGIGRGLLHQRRKIECHRRQVSRAMQTGEHA